MIINEKMENAINDQINKELYSAYLYYSMASYFEGQTLPGMAKWLKKQAKEELEHADKLFDYLVERGGTPVMEAIDKPKSSWQNALDAFTDAYDHEKFVTESIYKLVDLAKEIRDHATDNFLQWFVAEQVEEEDSAAYIVDRLKMIENHTGALIFFDKELGSRE